MEPASQDATHRIEAHPAHRQHHFASARQQFESARLGMWLFLSTEVLLFSGLFCAYSVYRANHPEIFMYAHQYLDKVLGGVNTLVLICSSLTMAWAVRCAQCSQRTGLIVNLVLTLLLAGCFLSIKYVEYRHKWREGLLWGARFEPKEAPGEHGPISLTQPAGTDRAAGAAAPRPNGITSTAASQGAGAVGTQPARTATAAVAAGPSTLPGGLQVEKSKIPPAATGPGGLAVPPWTVQPATDHAIRNRPNNVQMFFGVYFTMTGLHALHVLAGMSVIVWLLVRSMRGHFHADYFTPVDLGGLYWHLVDVIWIFLFPLLYLIH